MRHSSLLGLSLSQWLGRAAAPASEPDPPQQGSMVEATLALVEQQYCAPSPALTSLPMRLKIELILYKGHNLFYQTGVRSMPSEEAVKPHEIVFANARIFRPAV